MKKGEKLEKIINQMYPGWSLNRFAEHAGIKKTTLYDILKKESFDKVGIESIRLISSALNMSIGEFLFRMDNDIDYKERIDFSIRERNEKFRIYSKQSDEKSMSNLNYFGCISAGRVENIEGIKNAEQITLPKIFLGKYQNREDIFVMKTNGDSMNKKFPDGSFLICLPVENIEEIKENDIVIFEYNKELAVKRYRTSENHIIFSPESTTNKFYDVVISKGTISEVRIIAKVISYHVILD